MEQKQESAMGWGCNLYRRDKKFLRILV